MVAVSDKAVRSTKWVTVRAFLFCYSKLETTWNHVAVELGRDLWKSPGSTPLLKQDNLEPVSQDCVQRALQYLQGWRLHNLPEQLVPVLGHPHSKKVFQDVQTEPAVLQFVSTASGLFTGHH